MNTDFKKIIKISTIQNAFLYFWKNYYRWVFIFSLIIAMGIGMYIWYNMVVNFQWTEEEKNNYRQSTMKEVNLRSESFKKTLDEIDHYKSMFDEEYIDQKDVFKKY